MRAGWILFVVCSLSLIDSQVASAGGGALRCGNKVVTQGDLRDAVRRLCGDPVDIAKSFVLRRPSYVRRGRIIYFGDEIETEVEKWTYNFGPNKLMHRLTFVDSKLEEIEVLGYGYNEKQKD